MRRALILLTVVILSAAAAWWVGGDRLRFAWSRIVQPPSAHERYTRALAAANLHTTALGRTWTAVATSALQQPQRVALPFAASGVFDAAAPSAASWRFRAMRGRRLEVDVEIEAPDGNVFVDLFEERNGTLRRAASADEGATTLRFEPPADGSYVLRVQPELLRGGKYTIHQRAVATLRFPVAGATAQAVQSVYGDPRDRGARSHQGVDIFAPRGTPAIAATDGWVTSVGTNRLGGKVVWVWDGGRGQAMYYAHLDRQDVSPGARVRAGDVLGRVGNTGNARTTAPHLHFGIYRPIEGAVDPLPFICDAPCGVRGMAYAR